MGGVFGLAEETSQSGSQASTHTTTVSTRGSTYRMGTGSDRSACSREAPTDTYCTWVTQLTDGSTALDAARTNPEGGRGDVWNTNKAMSLSREGLPRRHVDGDTRRTNTPCAERSVGEWSVWGAVEGAVEAPNKSLRRSVSLKYDRAGRIELGTLAVLEQACCIFS